MTLEIEDLYVRELTTSKFHYITIKDSKFSISPRTTGITINSEELISIKFSGQLIQITGPSNVYNFKDLS